jgi:hypothetical protein
MTAGAPPKAARIACRRHPTTSKYALAGAWLILTYIAAARLVLVCWCDYTKGVFQMSNMNQNSDKNQGQPGKNPGQSGQQNQGNKPGQGGQQNQGQRDNTGGGQQSGDKSNRKEI